MSYYENIIAQTLQIRRKIHQYPELGAAVHQTVGLVGNYLEQLGLDVHHNIGMNGLYADLTVDPSWERIGFRADMDALPIQEKVQHPWQSSRPGIAHLCGHDAHTAMLLGAAAILVDRKQDLRQNIRFIFQPDEENLPGGALPMIADGVLEGLRSILGMHVWPSLKTGTFGICKGPAMAQPDNFEITIKGIGGHAAYPEKCIDPILIAAQFIQNSQSLISRKISAFETAVLSFTKIQAGTTHNVIPEDLHLIGTVRTLNSDTKAYLRRALEAQLEALCTLHHASCTFEYVDGHAVTLNNEKLAQNLTALLGKDKVIYPHPPSMAGEDFGYYSQMIPACFVFLGCTAENTEKAAMLHNPYFDLDENCLEVGVDFWIKAALGP